jgi:VIT1/CCC1 family predicted Fe2+/Mn2+ transporter
LPPFVASLLDEPAYQRLRAGVLASTAVPDRARLGGPDYRGAFAVFLLVFASTFPLVVPFLVVRDAALAVRCSHAVGVVMLFFIGRSYGRIAGTGAWRMGLAMVGLGLALVALTIALGG